jgi:hypothetical protein
VAVGQVAVFRSVASVLGDASKSASSACAIVITTFRRFERGYLVWKGALTSPATEPAPRAIFSKLGFTATCNSEGADQGSGKKWTADLGAYFKGRHVCILPDNDTPGRKHAEHVARSLASIAASVRIVELPTLPKGGDVSDWLIDDPSGARLVRECGQVPIWEP